MKWKFCPECGHKLEADWKHCPKCGLKVGEAGIPYVPYYPYAPIITPYIPQVQPWPAPFITWSDSYCNATHAVTA